MKVRLGYACITNCINDSSSSPYTYSEYLKDGDIDKLDRVIISNLKSLNNIIDYNIKNNIHFYRISSKIIPLATKDDVKFDYTNKYKSYYDTIGKKINDSKMRVDFHPDQFCVLNSVKSDVVSNSVKILEYHYNLLNMLNIDDKVLILHVGSSTFGKDNSISRFINNFNKLPMYLRECIVIENDDKVFNVNDVLKISKVTGIPVVLDYHHHLCNKSVFSFEDVFNSWGNRRVKMHFSSPKNKRDYRSHNEYINGDDFINFIEILKKYDRDIDR
jgi:UV DNA damage endonuclease